MARMLCVDPGETVGWSLWSADLLLGGGQTPLWDFALDFHNAVADQVGPLAPLDPDCLRPDVTPEQNDGPISLIVIEKFALYPWKANDLHWDEFRTAQLIGALKFIATLHHIEIETQAAKIKEAAVAAGAEELFVKPLHENRHQNDSIMHGWFYLQMHREA